MALGVWHVGQSESKRGERIYDHVIANGKLQTKILREKWDVLEMPHHRRLVLGSGTTHLNHIKTIGQIVPRRTKPAEISGAGPEHDLLLAPIDRIETRDKGICRAGLYLHKNQHLAVTTHKVDLITSITRTSPVSRNDSAALFLA